jgi:hypothetical protein
MAHLVSVTAGSWQTLGHKLTIEMRVIKNKPVANI